jgi:hypothetical protein
MEFEQLREFAHSVGRTSVTALPIGAKEVTGGRKLAAEDSSCLKSHEDVPTGPDVLCLIRWPDQWLIGVAIHRFHSINVFLNHAQMDSEPV